MAFIAIEYLQAKTTTFTTSVATAITTDSATTALILSILGASGNYTTVAITDGVNYELMHITGVDSGALTVDRAQGGTTAVNLASGASIRYVWLTEGILATAPGGTVTCVGSGGTVVTGGPNYHITSPLYTFNAGAGIAISGSPTSPLISSTVPAGATGATGPTGPSTAVTGSGIATVTGGAGSFNVAVPLTAVSPGSGITITGTGAAGDPYVVTNAQTQGGTGTVTSLVAGAGIAITGATPTVNPTVSLTTTGISAGAYGGWTVDAYGRITAVGAGLVTNISTTTTGFTVATPTSGNWTVNIGTASTGTQGLVKLAGATAGSSNNSGDATSAVTPAGINAVINSLNLNPASFAGAGSQVALGAGSYTTLIASLPIVLALASGKSALIDIYVEVYDSAATTVPQNFGIGLFNGAALLAGNSNLVPSSTRNLKYIATGPLTATLTVNTTTLVGTQTLGNYYATIVTNG
jgi:hypothetical protein